MPATEPLVKLVKVSKRYGSPESATSVRVLEDVSLEIQNGETVAIVGPSGSGKSTLLHIIGTLDQATSGQVFLEGLEIGGLDEAAIAATRNRRLGFVFQFHYLLPQCTVLENVLVPTLAGKGDKQAPGRAPALPAEERARQLLDRVGLSGRLGHRPGQLSGGERQRVALVRALINQPRLLLADEPTGALDEASAETLAQLLVELNQEEKVTLVLVTHSRELAARMQRRFQLKGGQLHPLT